MSDPRNFIVNGGFDIWQRGSTTSAGGGYAADRWRNLFVNSCADVVATNLCAGADRGARGAALLHALVGGWYRNRRRLPLE